MNPDIALIIISQHCSEFTNCGECIFRKPIGCMFTTTPPTHWEDLEDENDEVYSDDDGTL